MRESKLNMKGSYLLGTILGIGCIFFLSFCFPTTQVVQPSPNVKLRQYTRIFLYSPHLPSTGAVRGGGMRLGPGVVGGAQSLSGVDVVVQALNTIKFELTALGLKVVDNPENAELIAEFSIDGLQHLLVGWVAEQAILFIKDKEGNTLFAFRAKAGGISTDINSLISKIVEAIRANY
jgi:hypothetical protein